MIIGVDLFILAAWNNLEDVDGLPLTTPSTMRLPFIRDRSVGNQTAYSEDDHVNSVAPGTSSGWEEPKRTKRNCNAIIWNSLRTSENHVNYKAIEAIEHNQIPCMALYLKGLAAVDK